MSARCHVPSRVSLVQGVLIRASSSRWLNPAQSSERQRAAAPDLRYPRNPKTNCLQSTSLSTVLTGDRRPLSVVRGCSENSETDPAALAHGATASTEPRMERAAIRRAQRSLESTALSVRGSVLGNEWSIFIVGGDGSPVMERSVLVAAGERYVVRASMHIRISIAALRGF